MNFTIKRLSLDHGSIGNIVGFIEVYQRAFAEKPWNETHHASTVYEEVVRPHVDKGLALVAVGTDSKKVVGISCCFPLEGGINNEVQQYLVSNINELPVPNCEKLVYMSELAVIPDDNLRRQGIATSLTDARMGWALERGKTHFVLRTDKESKSVDLYMNKYQAKIINSLVQEVGDAGCGSSSTQRISLFGRIPDRK